MMLTLTTSLGFKQLEFNEVTIRQHASQNCAASFWHDHGSTGHIETWDRLPIQLETLTIDRNGRLVFRFKKTRKVPSVDCQFATVNFVMFMGATVKLCY